MSEIEKLQKALELVMEVEFPMTQAMESTICSVELDLKSLIQYMEDRLDYNRKILEHANAEAGEL